MSWHTPSHWRHRGLQAYALLPLAWAYYGLRRLHYALRALQPYQARVPVIVVGNLNAGGSGKTPVALDLARYLSHQGEIVALISHGYGAKAAGPMLVTASADPQDCGDEALEMAQAYAGAQVWSGGSRADCAAAAVKHGATVLILDDAFSNPSVARDLDLLVVDSVYGFGNGFLLPAGPLREPLAAQSRAAAAIVLQHSDFSRRLPELTIAQVLVQVGPSSSLMAVPHKPVIAFCGLGLPEKFYHYLRHQGLDLAATVSFPDHHRYSEADLARLTKLAQSKGAVLVTTGKDAVKLPADFVRGQAVYVVQPQLKAETMAPIYQLVNETLQRFRQG